MNRIRLNVALLALAALVAAVLVALLTIGPRVLPGRTPAERAEQRYADVERSARSMVQAFLDVDYHNLDETTAQVLDLSTGNFKKQYQSSVAVLKESATQQQTVAKAKILEIGITTVDADSATVSVAADTAVTTKASAGKSQSRSWRLQLDLTRSGEHWRTSNLQFVG